MLIYTVFTYLSGLVFVVCDVHDLPDLHHLTRLNFFLGYTGRFILFSVITNIYNKKTKGPTLMELFTATGKLKDFFFF